MVVFINDSKKTNVSVVSEEFLRGSSVLKAPFLVQNLVSLSTTFFLKQQLWQLPYIVSEIMRGKLHSCVSRDLHVETLFHRHKTLT
jgi:hypothetical protein